MTRTFRSLIGSVVVTVALAACASGGASTTAPPSESVSGAPGSAVPSAEVPAVPPGSGEVLEPGLPEPGMLDSELVQPQPGQQNVMSVPIEKLEATVNGQTVTLVAHWSSGVAPCSVLDQVLLDVGDGTVDVTVREGTSDPNAMCVLMLQAKHTVVSFEVDPGSYTIRDSEGMAPPIEITVG